MRIFTNSFFARCESDRAAIVDSALRQLETDFGRVTTANDRRKIKRQIRRITAKAVEYGILNS
jgi:hypothetical protein